MLALKCHSLSTVKTCWQRHERGFAEDSGISFASVVGHWSHLHLQKSQMGYYLCLLDLVRLFSKRFRILIHCWKWVEKTTWPTAESVMEQLFKKILRQCRLNQSNERTIIEIRRRNGTVEKHGRYCERKLSNKDVNDWNIDIARLKFVRKFCRPAALRQS